MDDDENEPIAKKPLVERPVKRRGEEPAPTPLDDPFAVFVEWKGDADRIAFSSLSKKRG